MTCPAGHSFFDGEIPSPHSAYLIPDTEIDGLVERVIEAARSDDPQVRVALEIMRTRATAYTCPECSRLFFYDEELKRTVASYVKE